MIHCKSIVILTILALSSCKYRSKEANEKHIQIELQTKGCGSRSHLKVQNNISDVGTTSVTFDDKPKFEIKHNYIIKKDIDKNTLYIDLDYINNGVSIQKWKHSIVLDANSKKSYQPFKDIMLNVILID